MSNYLLIEAAAFFVVAGAFMAWFQGVANSAKDD
jgi:hypothetical protein